jgi:DNA-directed RNA polymerase sigma subunit (sigma70/sigma32)
MNKAQIQSFDNRHIKTSANQAHFTIQEIADMMNLPKERVRKIEAKALSKLRNKMQAKGTKLSDLI